MEGAWAAIVFGLFGFLAWVRQRNERQERKREQARCPEGKGLYPECLYVVTFSGGEMRVREPDGTVSSLSLAGLTRVTVETNDLGPSAADVWWVWRDSVSCVPYPSGATGAAAAWAFLEERPGYDSDAVGKAMRCTSNQTFVAYVQRT